MVSVRRDFRLLLVLGIGCVILLWHSLARPSIYNYFEKNNQLNHYMSSVARQPSGFPTRSDTNWAVQSQRMARGLQFLT